MLLCSAESAGALQSHYCGRHVSVRHREAAPAPHPALPPQELHHPQPHHQAQAGQSTPFYFFYYSYFFFF